MFFLLAAFMVVSIDRIKLNSLKINLPTDVPSTVHEKKEDFVNISITEDGLEAVDKVKMGTQEQFLATLQDLFAKNPDQKLLISADREARHGDVMSALGRIRQAGFQKVAFSIKNEPSYSPGGPDGTPAPAPAAPGASTAPAPAEPTAATAAPPAPAPAAAEPAPAAPAPAAPAPAAPTPAPAQ